MCFMHGHATHANAAGGEEGCIAITLNCSNQTFAFD
jgi:hypothetical protein